MIAHWGCPRDAAPKRGPWVVTISETRDAEPREVARVEFSDEAWEIVAQLAAENANDVWIGIDPAVEFDAAKHRETMQEHGGLQ